MQIENTVVDSSIASVDCTSFKKFIREVKDFAICKLACIAIEDAKKMVLDSNGPLEEIFNKYIADGTLEKAERRFKAFYEGECKIPHIEIEVSYLARALGFWKTFYVNI